MQLSLEVRGKKNLEESLDLYVSSELMEGDNQYLCEELGKKVPALPCKQGSCFSTWFTIKRSLVLALPCKHAWLL